MKYRDLVCGSCFIEIAKRHDENGYLPHIRFEDVMSDTDQIHMMRLGRGIDIPTLLPNGGSVEQVATLLSNRIEKVIKKSISSQLSAIKNSASKPPPQPPHPTSSFKNNVQSTQPSATVDHITILDPKNELPVKRFCTHLVNKCCLPTFMPNYEGNRTKKSENSFNSNFLGLLIVYHMNGQAWVSKRGFDDEDEVGLFRGYERCIAKFEPNLYQQVTNGKEIRIKSLNAFCINTKHSAKIGTWDHDSSAKTGLFKKHYLILKRIGFPFDEGNHL